MCVFEYGSGNSTIWWSKRVKRMFSVEHEKSWYLKMKSNLPDNVEYLYRPLDENDGYESAILDNQKRFDIIVIDGRRRVKCVKKCIKALKENGVIIFDNSDRERYAEGILFLVDQGYKSISFAGMTAIGVHKVETSVFYKQQNILDI